MNSMQEDQRETITYYVQWWNPRRRAGWSHGFALPNGGFPTMEEAITAADEGFGKYRIVRRVLTETVVGGKG